MKTNNNWVFIVALMATICNMTAFTSCKKLIEIPPPTSQISSDVLFTDSISVMGAVAGVYDSYGAAVTVPTLYSGQLSICTGLSADELVAQVNGSASDLSFYNNVLLASEGKVGSLWGNAYTTIYRVNAVLEGVSSSSSISTKLKQQLTGEMKFNRALSYFYLVNLFGEVPLILSTDFRSNATLPRSSVEQVYKQIVQDLKEAQSLLTDKYPSADRARPNLYVVNALLAKVYLYLGEWKNAEVQASTVINSGIFTMNQDITASFLYGNKEAIWQLPANGTAKQTAEATTFVPRLATLVPTYTLSITLLNAFEPGDLRRQQWIGSTTVTGVNYTYPNKYKNRLATAPIEGYMMMRLAEIYLIRAEASAQQNNLSAAVADLGMVRNPTRVGLPRYSGPLDQATILNAILSERRVELFCESGNRWFDLRRSGTINAVLGALKVNWKPTAILYPVPTSQLESNPFLKQNPGYN